MRLPNNDEHNREGADSEWEWRAQRHIQDRNRKYWHYAYSWKEVRYASMNELDESDYEYSHFCEAPEDADRDYLLATGHYAWWHSLGDQ